MPNFQLDCDAGPDVPHVGIVFVHGIGSQQSGETLLDWGGKLIGLLLDARSVLQKPGDPVIDVQLDPGTPASSHYVELKLPKATEEDGRTISEQHWVMTEAWWANRVRPPSFGEMAEWLGPRGAIKRIVLAMLPRRRGEHDPRKRPAMSDYPLTRGAAGVQEAAEPGSPYLATEPTWWSRVQSALRPFRPLFDTLTDVGTLVTKLGAGLYFQAISSLVLVLYGALRTVEKVLPIGPLRSGALTGPIDRFVLEWFGDVYVLLRDPAQAASVRGRLVEALRDLDANDCGTIVIAAHSGGAIVSYMTLADQAYKGVRVDRLITLGEGLNLAWRLTSGDDGVPDKDTLRRYDRLYEDMLQIPSRKNLEWHDFWASQDPAPVGVLAPAEGSMSEASLRRIHSHAVWNRLSFGEDHGTYWDNDEEFLIPVARLLDHEHSAPSVFGTGQKLADQSTRRRRRLSLLSIWRQLGLVAPTAAIVAAFAIGSDYANRAAHAVASMWSQVPGNEIISTPLTSIRAQQLDPGSPWLFLAETGRWVIVVVLGALTLVALIAPPERPLPWTKEGSWSSSTNLFAQFLRVVPWIVAAPVVVMVGRAAVKVWLEATPGALEIGAVALRLVLTTIVIGGLGYLMFGNSVKPAAAADREPTARERRIQALRDGIEMAVTIFVTAVVFLLAIAPFVSTLLLEAVGTSVLGWLTIIAAFQVIARIGTWRWNVWDARERVAARMVKPAHFRSLRIVVQMALLIGTVLVGVAAVIQDSSDLTAVAAAGVAAAVLLGIAVDVFDAARQTRRDPLDAMLQMPPRL